MFVAEQMNSLHLGRLSGAECELGFCAAETAGFLPGHLLLQTGGS